MVSREEYGDNMATQASVRLLIAMAPPRETLDESQKISHDPLIFPLITSRAPLTGDSVRFKQRAPQAELPSDPPEIHTP
jgi:hypothetical protein